MASTASHHRLLFVDDDADVRTAFAKAAGTAGIDVDLAASGQEALRMAESHDYPVVATDLRMPDLDGVGLMKKMTERAPATVFVVVSGYPNLLSFYSNPVIERSISSLVVKPWDHTELVEVLRRAFELHDARASALKKPVQQDALPFLLVDESEEDARHLTLLLADTDFAGRPIEHAGSLNDAIPLIRDRRYDLVITELALPDARGLDTVHRLRTAAAHNAFVVLAGFWDQVLAMQALEIGALDYLVKPSLDANQLNRALHYALKRKRSEESLAQRAHADALTGLLSPTAFADRLEHALSVARRHGRRIATMVLDLEGLDEVNEQLGFAAGNAVLRRFAARLQHTLRGTDSVTRLGGSEFGVLLEDMDPLGVGIVTERLLRATGEPLALAGTDVEMNWSVGVALFPESGEGAEELLRSARASLEAGKRRGTEVCRIKTPA